MIRVAIYLASIILANYIATVTQPLELGVFIVPWGTFFIGLTLVMRDMVQNVYGRRKTYGYIILALVLSAAVSLALDELLWIVLASTLSFIISETVDTEIYTRFKLPFVRRVFYSGVASGFLDSSVFIIVGISPLGLGYVPWELVPYAILGQWVTKVVMQLVVAGGIRRVVIRLGIYEPNITEGTIK